MFPYLLALGSIIPIVHQPPQHPRCSLALQIARCARTVANIGDVDIDVDELQARDEIRVSHDVVQGFGRTVKTVDQDVGDRHETGGMVRVAA